MAGISEEWSHTSGPVVSKTVFAIDAGTLFTPDVEHSPGRIIIEDELIADVGPAERIPVPPTATKIDTGNMIVVPGFIEPHIHGCGGVDVMEGTYEALNTVSRVLAHHGTTSFLPTTVSSSVEVLTSAVQGIGKLIGETFAGARPLGIHLEGPFINPNKRGTHKSANVRNPDIQLFREWTAASGSAIRLLTLAPELPGAAELTEEAKRSEVRVAMGHSNASFDEAQAAANHGVCYAVHTFNAMRELTHRDPGIVGSVLSDDRVFAEIIADGVHVAPAVIKFFARAKRAERILLVSDAISATGMPDGEYRLGMGTVTVAGGVCRDNENRLAGSTLTQDIALKNFLVWTGFSLQDALRALTHNPATALGLRGKGVLEVGADADITVLDASLRVMKTFVGGKLVFER